MQWSGNEGLPIFFCFYGLIPEGFKLGRAGNIIEIFKKKFKGKGT